MKRMSHYNMMTNKLNSLLLSALLFSAQSAFSNEAKLVQVSLSGGLPEGVGFNVKPNGYKYGASLFFYLEGKNLIGFDKESLSASGWELGFWPRVSKNGDAGLFQIHKKGDFINKPETLKVNGKITVLTGSAVKKESKTLGTVDNSMTVGPFEATLVESKWSKGVKLEGELSKIKSLKVMSGGKVLRQGGSMSGGKSATYNFKKIKEGDTLVLEYYTQTGFLIYTFKK